VRSGQDWLLCIWAVCATDLETEVSTNQENPLLVWRQSPGTVQRLMVLGGPPEEGPRPPGSVVSMPSISSRHGLLSIWKRTRLQHIAVEDSVPAAANAKNAGPGVSADIRGGQGLHPTNNPDTTKESRIANDGPHLRDEWQHHLKTDATSHTHSYGIGHGAQDEALAEHSRDSTSAGGVRGA